jgi:serine protease SohB
MEQLIEFGVFAGKIVLVFLFFAGLALLIVSLVMRQKAKPELEVEHLNQKLDDLKLMLEGAILDKKGLKALEKELKKKEKEKAQLEKTSNERKPHVFSISFEGDIHANAVDQLRDEVTAVLSIAKTGDEVVLEIESPGGTVHGYGLAAAQLLRLKKAGLTVTVCVDRVAASGGYMMACTAHKILAAPFAIIGSIGVLAQVPNFHKLLKKHNVDYEEISSGEYKRTVSVLGEITDKGRAKFQEQIADTHDLFKEFVKTERPQVDISKVATGEYWYGHRAKDLQLVDELMTSDEYLVKRTSEAEVFKIKYQPKRTLSDKLSEALGLAAERSINRVTEKLLSRPPV